MWVAGIYDTPCHKLRRKSSLLGTAVFCTILHILVWFSSINIVEPHYGIYQVPQLIIIFLGMIFSTITRAGNVIFI